MMRLVRSADVPELVETLVLAFHDDPFYRWLVPDAASRPAALRDRFAEGLAGSARAGLAFRSDGGNSILIVEECDATDGTPPAAVLRDDRVGVVGALLRSTHPRERHDYIDMLATHPTAQGRGEGAQLAREWLDTVDHHPRPVHLHSSNAMNRPFYRRLGFAATNEVHLPDGSTATAMTRPLHRRD